MAWLYSPCKLVVKYPYLLLSKAIQPALTREKTSIPAVKLLKIIGSNLPILGSQIENQIDNAEIRQEEWQTIGFRKI